LSGRTKNAPSWPIATRSLGKLQSGCEEESMANKKFSLPLGKVLMFNLKGKAIEESADERDVRAYLIEKGYFEVLSNGTVSFDQINIEGVPFMKFADWVGENSFKSAEERNKAFNALAVSDNPPNWMRALLSKRSHGGGAA
jgi:hypothetical protein